MRLVNIGIWLLAALAWLSGPASAAAPSVRDLGGGWLRLTVQPGDSLSTLFQRAGLPASEWAQLLQLGEDTDPLRTLQPGESVDLLPGADGRLAQLRKALGPLATLVVLQREDGFGAQIVRKPAQLQQRYLRGSIQHSLARAVHRAGGTSAMAVQLARIFGHRVHMARDIRPGDHFSVVFEEYYVWGRPVQTGNILAARLHVGSREYAAFRYTDKDGRSAYYNARGLPYEPSILRAPVHYSHISSGFSLHRMNPVLHYVRPHYGIDYAAPAGTPIDAAADGRVTYVGIQHGYGRLVKLRHDDGYSTRYAHMSAFADGLHVGSRVVQGQVIGYVGASGEATGPHLHFEIRRHDRPYNPLTVTLPKGRVVPERQMAQFHHYLEPLVAGLERAELADAQVAEAGAAGCPQPAVADPLLALVAPAGAVPAHCRYRWLVQPPARDRAAGTAFLTAAAGEDTRIR